MKIQIPNYETAHVLVVGDVMLDRYWHGSTSRISPEAPVPVVHVQQMEERPGGAGNVALNLRALGCKTSLFAMCGDDSAADVLQSKLDAAGIDCFLQRITDMPTITKLRILSLHQQLIRLDFEEDFHAINPVKLLATFRQQLPDANVIILSDYAKGVLQCRQELIAAAREAHKPILIDPKGKDFSIYRGATLLTPNRKEFEAVVGPCHNEDDLIRKGLEIIRAYDLGALLVTRGEQGMTLIREEIPELHLPAREREVYDVTGAGDTVIAVLAATLAAGQDLAMATTLANIAAGIVVGKLGAATVSVPELRRATQEEHTAGRGIMTEDQLMIAIEDARAHGERIIMTNGCFDILHAGHIMYLEQAKALGQRLIVAVNDDASVIRLKGKGRPINNLAQRMAVLAGLSAVDWVVPFSEDTPEHLICRLLPDILVKGGDYKNINDIAGSKCVIDNGGEVKLLGFLQGHSTSDVVEKIRKGG